MFCICVCCSSRFGATIAYGSSPCLTVGIDRIFHQFNAEAEMTVGEGYVKDRLPRRSALGRRVSATCRRRSGSIGAPSAFRIFDYCSTLPRRLEMDS